MRALLVSDAALQFDLLFIRSDCPVLLEHFAAAAAAAAAERFCLLKWPLLHSECIELAYCIYQMSDTEASTVYWHVIM